MVSRLWVAAVARLEVSSTSCSTAWTDSLPVSAAASLVPPELAMDVPWSAAADFPLFPLFFALGGALEAIEAELPDAAVPVGSGEGAVAVVAGGGGAPGL